MWYNECIEKLWCYWVLNDFGRKLPYALSTYPKPKFLTIVHTYPKPKFLTIVHQTNSHNPTPTTPPTTPTQPQPNPSTNQTHATQTHTPSPAS